jgi:hypothetical protein
MSINGYKPLVLSKDNPFRERVEKNVETTTDSDNGLILNETVTIVRKREYLKGPWIRLTQDKQVLDDLSPWACKILIHIALNMSMNDEKIKISRREVGIDKRMFSRSMLELLSARVIANTGKREWYWINVGILLMGKVTIHE